MSELLTHTVSTALELAICMAWDRDDKTITVRSIKTAAINLGIIRETKNTTHSVYLMLQRSGQFERISPGHYKLVDGVGVCFACRSIIKCPIDSVHRLIKEKR